MSHWRGPRINPARGARAYLGLNEAASDGHERRRKHALQPDRGHKLLQVGREAEWHCLRHVQQAVDVECCAGSTQMIQ